jgi:2'-5' RNA ligase
MQGRFEGCGEEDFGTWEVVDLAAYQSDLRPDGARYTNLWRIPLADSCEGG